MTSTKKFCVLFAFGVSAAVAAEAPAATVVPIFREARAEAGISPEILTNEGVVALADAGYSDAFIVERILTSNRTRFDISSEGLAYMRRNAIPQDLVQFILEHSAQPLFRAVPVEPAAPTTVLMKVRGKKMYVPVAPPTTVALTAAPGFTPAMPAGVMPSGPYTGQAAPVYVYATAQASAPVYVYGSAYSYAQTRYGSYAYPAYSTVPVPAGAPQMVQVTSGGQWWK